MVCLLWNEGWALNFGSQSSNSQYIRQKSFFNLPSMVSRLMITRCLPIQACRDPRFDVVESNYSFRFVCIHKPQSSVKILFAVVMVTLVYCNTDVKAIYALKLFKELPANRAKDNILHTFKFGTAC